ncbi:MAG: type III secretion system translocon protein, EspA family [Glomeribacter sp. 1016415]|nr:type III secretion system translocon protein, EspA family [Glomeribacter sp. 1016415]
MLTKASGSEAATKVTNPYVSEPQPGLTKSDSILGRALVTMEDIMALFTDLARGKFEQMEKKSAISRDAQDQANLVEAEMANLHNEKNTGPLPDSVKKYMSENHILVDGKEIDQFVGDGKLNKGAMMKVKSALESVSTRASDFVQQNQLKLQQMLQNFNTAVTMSNSLQAMNAESTKSIAQSIR